MGNPWTEREVEQAALRLTAHREFRIRHGCKGPINDDMKAVLWALARIKKQAYAARDFVADQDEEIKSYTLRYPATALPITSANIKYRNWMAELRAVIEPLIKSLRP